MANYLIWMVLIFGFVSLETRLDRIATALESSNAATPLEPTEP